MSKVKIGLTNFLFSSKSKKKDQSGSLKCFDSSSSSEDDEIVNCFITSGFDLDTRLSCYEQIVTVSSFRRNNRSGWTNLGRKMENILYTLLISKEWDRITALWRDIRILGLCTSTCRGPIPNTNLRTFQVGFEI